MLSPIHAALLGNLLGLGTGGGYVPHTLPGQPVGQAPPQGLAAMLGGGVGGYVPHTLPAAQVPQGMPGLQPPTFQPAGSALAAGAQFGHLPIRPPQPPVQVPQPGVRVPPIGMTGPNQPAQRVYPPPRPIGLSPVDQPAVRVNPFQRPPSGRRLY